MKIQEGYMPFRGYQTYYRIVGEKTEGKLPLLALHGGPGMSHNYLESLDGLAEKYGRQVIYYDQIGGGKSVVPVGNSDMYDENLFLDELAEIRKYLGLDHVHILGQSWGGMLLMLYAIKHPVGVESMIIASSPANVQLWVKEALRLRSYLPGDMAQVLLDHDEDADYSSPLAQAAFNEYYRRHVCNLNPYPDYVAESFAQSGEAYLKMQGAGEFVATGTLKNFDVTPELPGVTIPTLITSGQLDEATPMISKQILDLIPGSKWVMIEGGTHLCHAEFPDLYNSTVEEFMSKHDKY